MKIYRGLAVASFFVGCFVISLFRETEMPAAPLVLLFLFPLLSIPLIISLMMVTINKFPGLISKGAVPFDISSPKALLRKLHIPAFYLFALGAGRFIAILVSGYSLHDDLLIIADSTPKCN